MVLKKFSLQVIAPYKNYYVETWGSIFLLFIYSFCCWFVCGIFWCPNIVCLLLRVCVRFWSNSHHCFLMAFVLTIEFNLPFLHTIIMCTVSFQFWLNNLTDLFTLPWVGFQVACILSKWHYWFEVFGTNINILWLQKCGVCCQWLLHCFCL